MHQHSLGLNVKPKRDVHFRPIPNDGVRKGMAPRRGEIHSALAH